MELSLEAKQLIRKYVIGLAVVPSALLGVLAFALGFLINDWAKDKAMAMATTAATTAVFSEVIKLTSSAVTQLKRAEDASSKSEALLKVAQEREAALKLVTQQLSEAETKARSPEFQVSIIGELKKDPIFAEKVAHASSVQAAALKKTLDRLQYHLANGGYDGTCDNGRAAPPRCPQDYSLVNRIVLGLRNAGTHCEMVSLCVRQ